MSQSSGFAVLSRDDYYRAVGSTTATGANSAPTAMIGDEQHDRIERQQDTTNYWQVLLAGITLLVLVFAVLAFAFALLAYMRQPKVKDSIKDDIGELSVAVDALKNCSCRCRNITQAMIGPSSLVLTDDGCYVLTEDIIYAGSGLAIIVDRGVTIELDGAGYSITLTQLLAGAVGDRGFARLTVHDLIITQPETSRGTALQIGRNSSAVLERIRTFGSGRVVLALSRSNLIVRDVDFDMRYESAQMLATWGFGGTYAAQGIVIVNDATFLIDGAVLRCLDRRNVLLTDPDFGNDWLCRPIYVGLLSNEPGGEPGNSTHGVLRNIAITGTNGGLQAPYFDSLVIENVAVTCADGQFDTCVSIGCDTNSGALKIRGMTVDSRSLRPETYTFMDDYSAFWLVPFQIAGALNIDISGLHIVGRGGAFNDPLGVVFGTFRTRFPLLLIDPAPYCRPNIFDCYNEESASVVIRDSTFTATDSDTVGIIIGMGSGDGDPVSADLENVRVTGGAIGVLIGSYTKTARLHNVKISGSYYGLIVANNTYGVTARKLVIQDTCVPYWVQATAEANVMQDVLCTLNGENGRNDNSANNYIEDGTAPSPDTTVLNLFLAGPCGTAPDLFEAPDFAPYNSFVLVSEDAANTTMFTSDNMPNAFGRALAELPEDVALTIEVTA